MPSLSSNLLLIHPYSIFPLNLSVLSFSPNLSLLSFPLNRSLLSFPLKLSLLSFPLNLSELCFPLNLSLLSFSSQLILVYSLVFPLNPVSVNSLNQSLSSFSSHPSLLKVSSRPLNTLFLLHIHSYSVSLPNLLYLPNFYFQIILAEKLKLRNNDRLREETTQRRNWRRKLARTDWRETQVMINWEEKLNKDGWRG